MARRPGRYLNDIRQCSSLSFSLANTSIAGTTGAIGGFAVGALPAVAIQGGVSLLLIGQQIWATYKGENYSAPTVTLGTANLITAGAMMTAGVASGTALGLGLAAFSSAMFATWGIGHLYLNRFIKRLEQIQKDGQAQGKTPEAIQADLEKDPLISKLSKRFQACYGMADMGAILNAAAHGQNFQELTSNLGRALMSWETLIPLGLVSLGLSRSFSKAVGEKIDAWTPSFLKKFIKTPNAAYSTACGVTAATIAGKATFAAISGNPAAFTAITAGKLAVYLSCAHGYAALDEAKKLPQSADDFARENGYLPSPTRDIA
ncbi:MAG: hypothetical protein LRY54_02080 [Alphaproteobacteria bacterium]|nr:hypothetical protein [Alphaproteobacteria bacterium]